jgi:pre-mRNA-splicing factor 18
MQAKQQEKSRSAAAAVVVGTEAEGDPTAVAFAAAAASLAAQRAEAALEPPDRVVAHFKRLMEEWEAETQGRAEAQPAWGASLEGRNAVSVMRLSKEHIRPLFRQLKRRECPADIERALWCIVKAMRVRNYKEAGDLYVRLAIGNAPWPIGVTMVGIHERSAREKISATSTAHIMHDEQSRKYLQAVKRLITYAQRAHPSTPSLSVEFDASANGGRQPMMLTSGGEGAAASGSAPLLLLEAALPSNYVNTADGTRQDGWRANDADTRTWKSIMRGACVCRVRLGRAPMCAVTSPSLTRHTTFTFSLETPQPRTGTNPRSLLLCNGTR